MILGGGPNRIGQGIEFDYCCCHASFALRELGIESIMVNSNPETVSTDYDTSDLLFFEPLTTEDVLNIVDRVDPDGVIVQFGGQTPLNLSRALATAGVPIIGTSVDTIEMAEDREKFQQLLQRLDLRQPANGIARTMNEARAEARQDRLSESRPPQFRARRPGNGNLLRPIATRTVRRRGVRRRPRAARAHRPLFGRCNRGRRRCDLRRPASDRRRDHGAYRRGGRSLRRLGLRHSALQPRRPDLERNPRGHAQDGAAVESRRADERAIRDQARRRPAGAVRARSQPAGQPHRAVRRQGDRNAGGPRGREGDGRRLARRAGIYKRPDSQPCVGERERVSVRRSSPASTSCSARRCARRAR